MNKKLAEERSAMLSLERWEVVWTAGAKGGVCRIELLIDIDPVRGSRKYVWLERRTGNRPPAEFLRHMIRKTVRSRLPIPEEEPVERILNLSGSYRVQLRRNPWRSIRVNEQGGVSDFLLSGDELPRLLYWFPDRDPVHADGEDVAVFAI